jgi:hypothetical protein
MSKHATSPTNLSTSQSKRKGPGDMFSSFEFWVHLALAALPYPLQP